jgi:hypothetical protein
MAKKKPATEPRELMLSGDATLEIQAAAGEGESPTLPRFSMVAYTGGTMKVTGWRHPVVIDLAGMAIPAQARPIRMGHDAGSGVGHTDSIQVINGQVVAAGVVSRDTATAREVVASSRNGFPWQASVGASVEDYEAIPEGKTITVNGRAFEGPLNVVRKSTLGEISFVDLGADQNTSARVAAMRENESDQGGGGEDNPAIEGSAGESLARVRRERERQAAIQSLAIEAAGMPGSDVAEIERLVVQANGEGWSAQQFELHILRATRPRAPIVARRQTNAASIEAALCLSAGLREENVAKWYGDDAVEAGLGRDMRGLGLAELFHLTIQAAGRHARPGRMDNATIRSAFEADLAIQASGNGFSTISLSGILSAVAGKALLESFNAVDAVGPRICGARDVNDFKQVSSYRMTGAGVFDKVGPAGELKSTLLTDATYTNQVETYGKVISLTRQMIINDDLGAFLQIPRILGRQSALALETAIFTLLLSNPSNFFGSGNKNNQSGAGTALQISSLTTAEQLFLDQVDADGKPILLSPAYLLVPTSLKVTAQQLMTETRVNETTTANVPKPANNPHAGKWEPLASPFLNSQALVGQSSTAWYLFANPADVAALEVAYLRGQRVPTIESGQTDFDTLGMKWRGYFDFGVAVQDPRGAVRSVGA